MTAHPHLIAVTPKLARLDGALTMYSVLHVLESGRTLIQNAPQAWTLDMANVTQVSSAAVALLLEWLKAARRQNKDFRIQNLPTQLLPILRISDLEPLFTPLLRPAA